jgi:Uma2 family endonuclease
MFYPESDGTPMAETNLHWDITAYLVEALKVWFRDVADVVYVAGDMMMYYVEGNPRVSISPDVFVAKGAPQRRRRVYKFWEEPPPCVVIEVSSRKTKIEDLRTKFEVYRDVLRVREYYIYDPERDYLPRRLRGWVLRGGEYFERRLVNGRMRSRELGLDLVDDRGFLRLVDPRTGRVLPDLRQSEDARRLAEDARCQAEDARRAAEAELARIREENRRLREAAVRPRRVRTRSRA